MNWPRGKVVEKSRKIFDYIQIHIQIVYIANPVSVEIRSGLKNYFRNFQVLFSKPIFSVFLTHPVYEKSVLEKFKCKDRKGYFLENHMKV